MSQHRASYSGRSIWERSPSPPAAYKMLLNGREELETWLKQQEEDVKEAKNDEEDEEPSKKRRKEKKEKKREKKEKKRQQREHQFSAPAQIIVGPQLATQASVSMNKAGLTNEGEQKRRRKNFCILFICTVSPNLNNAVVFVLFCLNNRDILKL
jgi:chromatin remodeling complex protein RSC6